MPKFAANISLLFSELPYLDRFQAAAAAAQRALQIWEQSNKPTAAAATRSRLTLYTDKQ